MSLKIWVKPKKRVTLARANYADPISLTGIHPSKTRTSFGVELEIGFNTCGSYCPRHIHTYYDDWRDEIFEELESRIGGYFSWHEDCGALEIASAPLSFINMHHYLDALLGDDLPYSEPPNSDWGMHVHISSKACQGMHLDRLLRFMLTNNRRLMRHIANRTVNTGWGSLPSYDVFIQNLSYYASEDKDDFLESLKRESGRYGIAINTHHGTHEFRLFMSTRSADRAKANLQFVHAVVAFTKPANQRLEPEDFLDFVENNDLYYPDLAELLKTYQR